MAGEKFAREQRLTATVFIGGNESAQRDENPLCDLTHCLTSGKIITPQMERELAARGLDLRGLLACLEQKSCGSHGCMDREHPYAPGATVAATPVFTAAEVSAAFAALQQKAVNVPAHFAELVKAEPPRVKHPEKVGDIGPMFGKSPQIKPKAGL